MGGQLTPAMSMAKSQMLDRQRQDHRREERRPRCIEIADVAKGLVRSGKAEELWSFPVEHQIAKTFSLFGWTLWSFEHTLKEDGWHLGFVNVRVDGWFTHLALTQRGMIFCNAGGIDYTRNVFPNAVPLLEFSLNHEMSFLDTVLRVLCEYPRVLE